MVAALIPEPGFEPGRSDRWLVQQRLPGGSRALLWEFPGGKVEAGETDEHALVRECDEELGVTLSVGRQLWSGRHAYPDLTVVLVLYAATIAKGTPKPFGANELRYLSFGEMQALPFCEADIPLLDELVAGRIEVRSA